jgi:ribose-phosphate pyrophosphokinase
MSKEAQTDMLSVFAFGAGRPLAERICRRLGIALGALEERSFEDGEHKLRPLESVRGRDVYVVQSLYGDAQSSVNDKLVRTLFLVATLKDAGAERVTCIAPYLCYVRKDRRTKPRDPVTNRYVAALLEAVGTDRVVTLEVHNPAAYENAFRIPAEHLTASPLWVQGLFSAVRDRKVTVVSPDAASTRASASPSWRSSAVRGCCGAAASSAM